MSKKTSFLLLYHLQKPEISENYHINIFINNNYHPYIRNAGQYKKVSLGSAK